MLLKSSIIIFQQISKITSNSLSSQFIIYFLPKPLYFPFVIIFYLLLVTHEFAIVAAIALLYVVELQNIVIVNFSCNIVSLIYIKLPPKNLTNAQLLSLTHSHFKTYTHSFTPHHHPTEQQHSHIPPNSDTLRK